jgi:hypothetical protein
MPRFHQSVRAIAAVGVLGVSCAERDKTLAGVAAFLSDPRANERASRECFARWNAGREVAELRTFRAKALKMAFPSRATGNRLGCFGNSTSGIIIRVSGVQIPPPLPKLTQSDQAVTVSQPPFFMSSLFVICT